MRNELLQQAPLRQFFPQLGRSQKISLQEGGGRRGVMVRLDRGAQDGCFCGLREGGGKHRG